jgi:hypothetical protein
MDAQPKLQLIQALGVAPVAARWADALPVAAADPEAAAHVSGLLNTLAYETIESMKRLENQVIGMQVRRHAGIMQTSDR